MRGSTRFGAVFVLLLGCVAAAVPADPTSPRAAAGPPGVPGAATAQGVATAKVVALGDSVPSGAHCDCDPYPALVAQALGPAWSLDQLAEDGATSTDTAQTAQDSLATIGGGDLVLLETGANDLAPFVDADPLPTPAQVDTAVDDAVDRVTATLDRLGPTGARVVVLDYWAVGLDGDVAARTYTGPQEQVQDELTDAFDDRLAAVVGPRATVVGLRPVFHGPDGAQDPTALLADDGDHPDTAGHEAIAAAVLAALHRENATGSPNIP
ncbi:SGNH/GDSL hydrolase family protein [Kineococcus rhizosphaerae]|uniref:SGNH/GDSL hydrolase family protein n=1 Tax=Kineococcus rhizosphaerae TaxID=559628 RepID=UPI0014759B4B|nr:SGNH/GDSL hydrolase family protein [Kineococcus rhizosphaerae]